LKNRERFRQGLGRRLPAECPPLAAQVGLVGVPGEVGRIGQGQSGPGQGPGVGEPDQPGRLLGAYAVLGGEPGGQVAPAPSDPAGHRLDAQPAPGGGKQPPGLAHLGSCGGRRSRCSSSRSNRLGQPTAATSRACRDRPIPSGTSAWSTRPCAMAPAGRPSRARTPSGVSSSWMPCCSPLVWISTGPRCSPEASAQ
jgi:hypothetical protein